MYIENINKVAERNSFFRNVLYTGTYSQIVVMSLPVGTDIGEEVHNDTDQIIYIVDGSGEAIVDGNSTNVEEHDVVFVPAGAAHNLINTDDEDLKIFTMYAPPEHADRTIHKTKADAVAAESLEVEKTEE